MISISSGMVKGLRLKSPSGNQTRPSSERLRQAIFNVLRNHKWGGGPIVSGASVIDLFGGSGAWGLEALSHGAEAVEFVENHPLALSCLRENARIVLQAMKAQNMSPRISLYTAGVEEDYKDLRSCRILFADPPYEKEWFQKIVDLEGRYHRICEGGLFIYEADSSENVLENDSKVASALESARLSVLNSKIYGDSTVHYFVKGS